MLEQNRIHLGDSLELMKLIPDGLIDCCVSDIPYKLTGGGKGDGINSKRPKGVLSENNQIMKNIPSFDSWLPDLYRVMKEGSHIYLMVNFLNLNDLMNACVKAKFKMINLLVWKKNNMTPSQFYMKNCEYTLFLRKGASKYINNIGASHTVHSFDNVTKKSHPTQKPVSLMEMYVANSSKPDDLVLDMFSGSGSTAIACINTNRRFICIEQDEGYYKISIDRVRQSKSQPTMFDLDKAV